MRCRLLCILSWLLLLAACAAPVSTWRGKATAVMLDLDRQGASALFPQQYQSFMEAYRQGEQLLTRDEDEEAADALYLLALQKGQVLSADLTALRTRQQELARKQAAEAAAKAEEARLAAEVARQKKRMTEAGRQHPDEGETGRQQTKEQPATLPTSHTVRRGETLPQIAARTEVFNDASLWPIIYRANRDQIRDPRQLWPGQVLKIPRHSTREELIEAKRYSSKHRL